MISFKNSNINFELIKNVLDYNEKRKRDMFLPYKNELVRLLADEALEIPETKSSDEDIPRGEKIKKLSSFLYQITFRKIKFLKNIKLTIRYYNRNAEPIFVETDTSRGKECIVDCNSINSDPLEVVYIFDNNRRFRKDRITY